MFVKDDGIGVAHGRGHQAYHIDRRGGGDNLYAGDHHRPILNRLGVLRPEAHAAAVARPDHEGARQLSVRHVPELRHFIGDVVEADGEEVGEHDLCDRTQARHRCAHCSAENRLFGDRRVAHPQRSKLFVETDCRFEYAARLADVLAEEDDAIVTLHLLRDAARDGVAIGQFRHAQPPSAYTSWVNNSMGAGGDALHASVAASTFRLLSAWIVSIVA